jgi:hypothetical protein
MSDATPVMPRPPHSHETTPPKFYAHATGPQGGSVYKHGSAVAVGLRHESASGGIEVKAFLVDGSPHVRVELTTVNPARLIYSGPLAPQQPDAGPFTMTADRCACGRTMRVFEVEGGQCVGCAGLEPKRLEAAKPYSD